MRHAAEYELAQARMPEPPMTMKSVPLSATWDNSASGDVDIAAADALDVDLEPVTRQVLAHVGAFDSRPLCRVRWRR